MHSTPAMAWVSTLSWQRERLPRSRLRRRFEQPGGPRPGYSPDLEPEPFSESEPGSRRLRGDGCGREHPAARIGLAGDTVPTPGSDVDFLIPTSAHAFKSVKA